MPATPLHRRLSVGAAATGLLAAVLVPLTAASAAACATWTDPAGDATTDQSGVPPLADAQMDIVSSSFGTVGKDLVGTITTDGLGESSSDAGDEFRFRFTIAGQDVIFYVDRVAPPLLGEVSLVAGFYNFTADTSGDAEAVFDAESKTVTLTGPLEQLTAAVGKPVSGQVVTDLMAETFSQVEGAAFARYDDAPTSLKPVVGTACTIGGKPGPAPAPTGGASAAPSPSASASAAPSATPAASASASASAAPSGSAAPSAAPSASASPAPPQPTVPVPAAGCFGFADVRGDGRPGGAASTGNDPDLDLLAVTGRTTATSLAGHLQVDRLAARPSFPAYTGHRFEYQFTLGGKVVVLRASAAGPGTGLVDGATSAELKVTAEFDVVSSQVVLSVDRASLAAVLARTVPDGTVLDAQTGRSAALSPGLAFAADTAVSDDAGRARYTVGDNTCFAPKLSVSFPGQVQTGDDAVISIAMTTSDGRVPAAGQVVTAQLGDGRAVQGKTDARGTATLLAPVQDEAGLRQVVVRSSGSAGKGELTGSVRVVAERALLRLRSSGSGSSRTVTATLTDDDAPRRALAGQRLVFRFGGRTVAVSTDDAGRAVVRVPAGSAVEVSYAGRPGFVTGAQAALTAR